jgi:hypothetical protein
MTTRCPYCFVDLAGTPGAFRCEAGRCADEVDPVASGFYGSTVTTRPVTLTVATPSAHGHPNSAPCRLCGNPATMAVCPRCHAPLPLHWRQFTTTCIAMAGARASGKSIYIAVLKRQVEILAEQMGTSLGFLDAATERTYTRVYQEPLYEQRGLLAATARHETPAATQRAPLMFTMGMVHGRSHVLVIRDVAGENLEDPESDPYVLSFFRHADGVFFLVDPVRVDEIRQQLSGVVAEQQAVGGDPHTVLNNLIRLLRADGTPIPTPLAVVLAKFDTLQELRNVHGSPWQGAMGNVGAAYSRDPSLVAPSYDEQDGVLLDTEVESLLTRMNAQALRNRVGQDFVNTRMFAVSALGAAPTGQALHPRGIAPFRCLDPLKWIFARSGVIKAV